MKTGKKIRCIVILFLLLCAGAYLGIACYYMDGFSLGTWINGVYCTGKTVEEVNAELLGKQPEPGLTVIYPCYEGAELSEEERVSSYFVLDERTVKLDYEKGLRQLLQDQRPLLWIRNLFLKEGGYELEPAIVFAEEGKAKFEEAFLSEEIVQAEKGRENCVRIERDEEGLSLYDGKKRRLDTDRALYECIDAIESGENSILLSDACYYDEKTDASERQQEELYRELQEFLDFEIIYDMGAEKVRFDRKTLVSLLAAEEGKELAFLRDEEGRFYWDQKKIEAAIEKLADTYDTYGKPRKFTMTGGGVVTLEKGNYGTQLDRKAEVKWLSEALAERRSETHVPSYLREAYARGENDIGDTYIEINMTKQRLWFYLDGKAEVETPVVTGNMMRRRGTPEGIYYIYGKQTNRILRGPGYASHVNYWMPVKGGVGIHDALWRDVFGGDIYKREGSHGCINLPFEAAEEVYGLAEIGMPVILYYEEEQQE